MFAWAEIIAGYWNVNTPASIKPSNAISEAPSKPNYKVGLIVWYDVDFDPEAVRSLAPHLSSLLASSSYSTVSLPGMGVLADFSPPLLLSPPPSLLRLCHGFFL